MFLKNQRKFILSVSMVCGLLFSSVSMAGPSLYTQHALDAPQPQCQFIWHNHDNPTGG